MGEEGEEIRINIKVVKESDTSLGSILSRAASLGA